MHQTAQHGDRWHLHEIDRIQFQIEVVSVLAKHSLVSAQIEKHALIKVMHVSHAKHMRLMWVLDN